MAQKYVVFCNSNTDYEVSLERHKFYVALRDQAAEAHDQIRVIDESGEDYLYPKALFAVFKIPDAVRQGVLKSRPAKLAAGPATQRRKQGVRIKGRNAASKGPTKASA